MVPAAASIPKSILRDPPCGRCDHPLSQHCKGRELHTSYKRAVVCVSRHCNNPLCSCVDFID